MTDLPTFAGIQFACMADIVGADDGAATMSPEFEVAEILETLSPSAFAVRRCLLRSIDLPTAGRKILIFIQAQEADLKSVELATSRMLKARDIESGTDTMVDFVSTRGGKGEIRALSFAFASYDLVIAIRPEPMSLPAARLVDRTVDLRWLTSEDVEAALRRTYPDDIFSMPDSFVWPEGLSLAALDLVCAKAAGASDAIERILSMNERRGEIVPEALGLNDLFGYGDAEIWARRLVEEIASYRAGTLPWRDVDSGMLLVGPPGTGKTELARRVAGAAGLPLVSTSYSEWQSSGDGHLGDVTKALRSTFEEARVKAPCILFIDEIDSIPARNTSGKDSTWFNAVVNALLEAMDGRDGRRGVVVMAACNDGRRLDPALLRPGRLNHAVRIELPDAVALSRILAEKLDGILNADALLPIMTTMAGSASGADMTALALRARRRARDHRREVVLDDVATVALPSDQRSLADRRRIAIHEGGHVLALLTQGRVPAFVTIVPFGGTQGSVRYLSDEKPITTREDLHGNIVALLAGRAAETVIFGEPSAGAGCTPLSDLAKATETAILLVGLSGLDGLVFEPQPSRSAVEAVLLRADADARSIMNRNKAALEELADLLVERQTLTAAELRAFARDRDLGPFRAVDQVGPPVV